MTWEKDGICVLDTDGISAPNEPSMRETLGIKDEDEQQKTREKTT